MYSYDNICRDFGMTNVFGKIKTRFYSRVKKYLRTRFNGPLSSRDFFFLVFKLSLQVIIIDCKLIAFI